MLEQGYMIKVLFVCMGNICRSPTAEGVFRHLVDSAGLTQQIHIDSAGTHAYHVGNPPDERSQAAALKRNINLSKQRARKVSSRDFSDFDYVLAMDNSNMRDLQLIVPATAKTQPDLFLNFAQQYPEREVPDPYYGGANGFEHVLDLVEDAARGLLDAIRKQHGI
jgi:protein-tyrosine phosphatase